MVTNEPMIAGVAGRYAKALFDLVSDEKQLDITAGQLNGLVTLLDQNKNLDDVLQSPTIGLGEKQNLVAQLVQKLGMSGITANFLGLVAKNNRLPLLRGMVRAFNALLARQRGEVRAQIVSAVPLSDKHREELSKALASTLGQEVVMEEKTDPELLGGLIVKIGSKMIDNSLRTKLDNLHAALDRAS